ncbi:hypothetical protein Pan216_09120 [Planctomycetes bacterium Pan216]|uniref:DUF4123 domain-containing protein n=1 Tax=Kolteria novifilia TaxID=2527975 RepID=A0A518AZC8_9BACT|nr:hypothetical protein Pan216_09120 [Planctomycetes bacterium Pan216]
MKRLIDWKGSDPLPDWIVPAMVGKSDDVFPAAFIGGEPVDRGRRALEEIESGRHVLFLPSPTTDLKRWVSVIALSREHGTVLLDLCPWLHHPRTARIYSHWHAEPGRPIVRATLALSADVLSQFPDVSACCWACVRLLRIFFRERPSEIYATETRSEKGTQLSAVLRFPSGGHASFDVGDVTSGRQWLELAGERTSTVCDDLFAPLERTRSRFFVHEIAGVASREVVEGEPQERCLLNSFVALAQEPKLAESIRRQLLDTHLACDALTTSLKTKSPVSLT